MKFCAIVHMCPMSNNEDPKFYVLPPEKSRYGALTRALAKFVTIKGASLNMFRDDGGFDLVTDTYEYKVLIVEALEEGDHFIR